MSSSKFGLGFVLAATFGLGAQSTVAQSLSNVLVGEADYSVPVDDPTLEPHAQFFVRDYSVSMIDDVRHEMVFNLPVDLAGGRKEEIRLVVTNPGARLPEPLRLQGPKGRAECTAQDEESDWDAMDCKFWFQNLDANRTPAAHAAAVRYVENKYRGQDKADERRAVVIGFLYEPIGIAATGNVNSDCECSAGNGEWRVRYQNPQGQWVDARMSLEREMGNYFTSSGSGELYNMFYDGGQTSGAWAYGSSSGWFRFRFDNDGVRFTGEWGSGGVVGQQRAGQWNGTRE